MDTEYENIDLLSKADVDGIRRKYNGFVLALAHELVDPKMKMMIADATVREIKKTKAGDFHYKWQEDIALAVHNTFEAQRNDVIELLCRAIHNICLDEMSDELPK
jgi:hypothetical protein